MKLLKLTKFALGIALACPFIAPAQSALYDWTTIAGSAGSTGSADGTNSAARFNDPWGIALDSSGAVYVADARNSTIRRLQSVGTNWASITIAGLAKSPGSTDGTNSFVRFNYPYDVAVDGSGNVFVADWLNQRLRELKMIGTNWVSSTLAFFPGNPGPAAVTVDAFQGVFVTDNENDTVHYVQLIGTNWVSSTIAGLAGIRGSSDGTNSGARFNMPAGVALDAAGNLYLADSWNHTIRELQLVGTNWVSTTIAGRAGIPGSTDGTNSAARFNYPNGIAVDRAGNIYVADSGNDTIRVLRPAGTNWVSATIAGRAGQLGSVDGTNSAARFNSPEGLTVDDDGNLYVTDSGNSTIRKGVPLVVPLPSVILSSITQSNSLLAFTWTTTAGQRYQVQRSYDASSNNWTNLGATITATSGESFSIDALGPDAQRFYRVLRLP